MATKLAHGVGLHCYRGETLDDAQAADRFEAYLAALSSANGRRSLAKWRCVWEEEERGKRKKRKRKEKEREGREENA